MSTDNAGQLTEARDVSEFAHEVDGAGEWMKKRDLVGKGPFNVIAGNERTVPKYQGKPGETTQEVVLTVQFLGGSAETNDLRGATVNTSLEADDSRRRVLTALTKYGPHGPYWMHCVEREGKNPYYRLSTKETLTQAEQDESPALPFDAPVAPTKGKPAAKSAPARGGKR